MVVLLQTKGGNFKVMKLRATVYLRSDLLSDSKPDSKPDSKHEAWVSPRFEIAWEDTHWINIGVVPMPELEWLLLSSLLKANARRVGASFEIIEVSHERQLA